MESYFCTFDRHQILVLKNLLTLNGSSLFGKKTLFGQNSFFWNFQVLLETLEEKQKSTKNPLHGTLARFDILVQCLLTPNNI